jgi:UDP-N-acetylglucosamine transferase subunit ALG13
VGATLPFDRLVRMVEAAKRDGLLPERVIVQVGDGRYLPDGVDEVRDAIPFEEVKDILRRADIVVCHGGTGSLITALQQGCRVIAVPRLFALGEHYDDHQLEITAAFAQRGLLAVVDEEQDFAAALAAVRAQEPVMATTDLTALSGYLSDLLNVGTAVRAARARRRSAA